MDEKNPLIPENQDGVPEKARFELKIDEQEFEEYGEPAPMPKNEPPKKDSRPKKKKKKKRRSVLGFFVRLIIILVILGLCAGISMVIINGIGDVFGLKESTELKEIKIEPNSSITQIAEQLEEEGIIDYPELFRFYIKSQHPDAVFNFGKFMLHPAMPYEELIEELQKSTDSDHVAQLTFKEGQNAYDYAQALEDAGVCPAEDFLNALNEDYPEYDFLPAADQVSAQRVYRLEGYLFPDTYEFYLNSDPHQVVTTFLDNFNVKFDADMRAQAQKMGKSIDEIVNLASIVQAEAPVADQMENVASVYWNRLNHADVYPKLESDPTGRYANRYLQPNGLSQEVLDAYNTYTCTGLPAGPIDNPGLDALKATLYPANTGYYFFCSNLDTGEFFYASTYEQHQANLQTAGLTE